MRRRRASRAGDGFFPDGFSRESARGDDARRLGASHRDDANDRWRDE
jgi:hypothetical protein